MRAHRERAGASPSGRESARRGYGACAYPCHSQASGESAYQESVGAYRHEREKPGRACQAYDRSSPSQQERQQSERGASTRLRRPHQGRDLPSLRHQQAMGSA